MRNLIVFCLASLACSCTRICFDVPQPGEVEALKAFPAEYIGKYLDSDSNDSIIINPTTVVFTTYIEKEISVHAIDTMTNISRKNGLLYDTDYPYVGGVPFTTEDTLVKYAFVERQPLGLSDTMVLKANKSYLVVSVNLGDDSDDYWDVNIVDLDKSGNLVVSTTGNLKTPDSDGSGNYVGDLEYFNKIAPYERIEKDTYLFRPDKKQFTKLVKKGLFSEKTTAARVK